MVTSRQGERAVSRVSRVGFLVAAGTIAAGFMSTSVRAHGDIGPTAQPVSLAVIVALPVATGLLGGLSLLGFRSRVRNPHVHRNVEIVVALLVLGLGLMLLANAVKAEIWLSTVGVGTGVVVALWFAHRGVRLQKNHPHADLTFGGMFLHRVFEGILIGALYSTGATAGIIGAIAIAGHSMLETTVVGGAYSTSQLRAVGGVILLQGAYVLGAFSGLNAGGPVPPTVHVLVFAFIGGILLCMGSDETRRLFRTRRPSVSNDTAT